MYSLIWRSTVSRASEIAKNLNLVASENSGRFNDITSPAHRRKFSVERLIGKR
jgi:hypothetical protein